jgi:aspartate kinase
MARIVMKFGGTSVADLDRIRNVAARVKREVDAGHEVAVVVSAMSGVTNQLVKWCQDLSPLHDAREYDTVVATGEQVTTGLTAIALQAIGVEARSWQGWQVPIVTDQAHGKARVEKIDGALLIERMAAGQVPVIAGFQGIDLVRNRITTLGRGGSDLSAVAVAAAVKADRCDIYTDVDGIYTTDPRIVPGARKIPEIAYDELLELAGAGAKVMQLRSVEFAKKFGVIFEVRSSLNDNPGTIVKEETRSMEDVVVRGVALDKNQAKITLVAVPDKPGEAARIFNALSDAAINVDMIVQNVSHGTKATDLSFTIDKPDLLKARKVIDGLQQAVGFKGVLADESIGKLSIVGVGMRSHSGVAAKMFDTLAKAGVNIDMISTSEIKISVVVNLANGEEGLRAVHLAFLG